MAMNMTLWRVDGKNLRGLPKQKLDQEQRLEDWVAEDSNLLGLDVLIIGRQVQTSFGGRIDLLGINQDGDLVLIELKRDKTPRDIVAQVLDYASWVDELGHEEIGQIAESYLNESLSKTFNKRFESPLPDTINSAHQMVIVAAELDDASERIAQYLASRHSVNLNVVFFNVFDHNGQELLARSWLMDPQVVEDRSEPKKRAPWSGIWYVNIGEEHDRSWADRRTYGFVSAGGGETYSSPLKRLKLGDQLFAYIKGQGYVGFGKVTQERVLAADFIPANHDKPLPKLKTESPVRDNHPQDGKEEYAVGVKWITSVDREQAKRFTGAFANQNVVCKLRDPATLEFLMSEFRTSAS